MADRRYEEEARARELWEAVVIRKVYRETGQEWELGAELFRHRTINLHRFDQLRLLHKFVLRVRHMN